MVSPCLTQRCSPPVQGAAALRSELHSAGAVLLGVLVAAREGPVVQYLSTVQVGCAGRVIACLDV